MAIQSLHDVYQFRVSLKDITPKIWRRVLMRSNQTLADLHVVIQIIMGWTDYHSNEFEIDGQAYSIANTAGMFSPGGGGGERVKLKDLKLRLNEPSIYRYDFTAGWEFDVRLEKILPVDEKKTYPVCISGSGASPDEECGGPDRFNWLKDEWSIKVYEVYGEMLKVLARDDIPEDQPIRELFDLHELRQAQYWMDIDKYKRRQVNRYLKHYANNDERWMDAFAEVIVL